MSIPLFVTLTHSPHSHPTAYDKVRAFQDLCLILDPLLQANPENTTMYVFLANQLLMCLSQSTSPFPPKRGFPSIQGGC